MPQQKSAVSPDAAQEAILRNIGRHISLDQTERDYFLSQLQLKNIPARSFILKPGEISRVESFIVSGCMRMFSIDASGTEHVLMFGIEDWWIGDMFSFLTQSPATYSIEALEDCTILQIGKAQLENLYDRVPKFDRFFRIILQNAYIAQQKRINENLSHTAEERYHDFVRKYPGLEQRISQKQIAAYLGVTPVFLSMMRKKRLR